MCIGLIPFKIRNRIFPYFPLKEKTKVANPESKPKILIIKKVIELKSNTSGKNM